MASSSVNKDECLHALDGAPCNTLHCLRQEKTSGRHGAPHEIWPQLKESYGGIFKRALSPGRNRLRSFTEASTRYFGFGQTVLFKITARCFAVKLTIVFFRTPRQFSQKAKIKIATRFLLDPASIVCLWFPNCLTVLGQYGLEISFTFQSLLCTDFYSVFVGRCKNGANLKLKPNLQVDSHMAQRHNFHNFLHNFPLGSRQFFHQSCHAGLHKNCLDKVDKSL